MTQKWSRYISNIETFHNKYIEVFLWISSNTLCQTLYSGTDSESSRHPKWIVGTDQLIVVFNLMASCWMCSTAADPFFNDQNNELEVLSELLASHTDRCHCRTSWYQNLWLWGWCTWGTLVLLTVEHMARWRCQTLATNTEASKWNVPHK